MAVIFYKAMKVNQRDELDRKKSPVQPVEKLK